MGNLGFYQDISKLIKILGGPRVAVPVILTGGYAVIRVGEAGAKKLFRLSRTAVQKWKATDPTDGRIFETHTEGEDIGGLKLHTGDRYRVVARDGDAILIEMLNNPDTGCFVSGKFLAAISDFPG